ncbi:Unknown protein [Striga hermonthica]|uniref:Uncharacterized protein n=1 Tax=Striga hermonthica TaxID=68872 RepID=A0A9N7RJQ1_STRHE|nr:Unknown protein [Striga hermonthica]
MAGSSSTSGTEHPSESGSDAVVLHENFAQNLAEFVAVENLPLDLGSGPPFEHLCRSLNPAAERVPTATLTRTVKSSYRESKKALIEQLACVKTQVSISVEIWRDYWQVHSYISVTCHWIDDSWSIQRRLLGFRLLQGAHTAENICRTVLSVLAEYDLLGKIFSILFECVGSNVASIEDLKPTFESLVGCRAFPFVDVCRVLSLCARDGLQQVELQLGPIRQAIGYLWSNPQVMNQWSKFCKTNNTKSEKFSREIPTRWDSTYLLLQQFLKHKELLRRFFALNVKGTLLFPNQWAVCEKVCVLLEKFYEGIQLISNDHYSNPSSLLTFVGYISWNLNKYYKDEDLKHCVEAMRSRLGKHGLNLPVINLVANVLDPRIRLGNLKHRLTMYYDNLIPVKDEHSPDPGIIESNVRQHLNDFYLEYKSKKLWKRAGDKGKHT